MKDRGYKALSLITSIILALGSVYLAVNKIEGWGWFLFGAIVTCHSPSFK